MIKLNKRFNFEDFHYKIIGVSATLLILILVLYGIQSIIYNPKDVNRDGKVNAQDYVEIKNYIMERDDCSANTDIKD